MKASRSPLFVLLLAAAVSLSSCSSTQLVSSWRNPATTVDVAKLKKVLVICLVKDETSRRVGEDEIVKRNPSFFVASYKVLPTGALKDSVALDKR